MVRRMRSARGEVHEEGLVGHQRLLLARPEDGVVGQILGQMVALLRRLRWLNGCRPLIECGIPLIGLATNETIEIFETIARTGPARERPGGACLPDRHLVALAKLRRTVAIEL